MASSNNILHRLMVNVPVKTDRLWRRCGRFIENQFRDAVVFVPFVIVAACMATVCLLGCKRAVSNPTVQKKCPVTDTGFVGTYRAQFPTGTTTLHLKKQSKQVPIRNPLARWQCVHVELVCMASFLILTRGLMELRLLFDKLPYKLVLHQVDGRWRDPLTRTLSAKECDAYVRPDSYDCHVWHGDHGQVGLLVQPNPEVVFSKIPP